MENVLRPYIAGLPGATLSATQQLVSSNLAPIFSFYTKKQLDAVVLYKSADYIHPLDAQGLLQQCIDFILDNPDAVEGAASSVSTHRLTSDVIDVFSDDDDIELLGAANFVESNLASNKSSFPIKSFGTPTYYGDDLPVISPPRKRTTEKTGHVDIVISDSPVLDVTQPVKSDSGLYASSSSNDSLPSIDLQKERKIKDVTVLKSYSDELLNLVSPKPSNSESAVCSSVKQAERLPGSDFDPNSKKIETSHFANLFPKDTVSFASSSPKKADAIPNVSLFSNSKAGICSSKSDITTDGAPVVKSLGDSKPEIVSHMTSFPKAPLSLKTSTVTGTDTSASYTGTNAALSPKHTVSLLKSGLPNVQYPGPMTSNGYSPAFQTPATAYPALYNYTDVLPKIDIHGRVSSGMATQQKLPLTGHARSSTAVKTFKQFVDEQVKQDSGIAKLGSAHVSNTCQTPTVVGILSNVQLMSPPGHKKTVAAEGLRPPEISDVHTSAQPLSYNVPQSQHLPVHTSAQPLSYNVPQSQHLPVQSNGSGPNVQPQPPAVPPAVPPAAPPPKTTEQQLEEWKLEVLQLFPKVDLQFLDGRLRAHYGHYAVNNVCGELLESPDYPKSQTEVQEKQPAQVDTVDYYKDYAKIELNASEKEESLRLLQGEFRRVSAKDIREVWSSFKCHYAPSYQVLEDAMKQAYAKKEKAKTSRAVKEITICMVCDGIQKKFVSKLLKSGRSQKPGTACTVHLKQEVDFVKRKLIEQKEKEDYEIAWKLNEAQYEEDGQTIECGCCYCEYPFENMVQCTDGHLFCNQCLLSYAKEAVFGSGKLSLTCMTTGCGATYPYSEMTRALPREILSQYEDRVREENLNLAELTNLVRCPHCNYAAIMDVEADKVFRCQNKDCMKETCRLCKEDWADHIGLPCEKVEKKDETKLRKEYEEKMTEAKVRTCHRCKAKFMKEEGCNKMTCTCQATMCYICRAPNIDYNHFCRHPRDPGKLCTHCKACSLWTNPDEDDKRAIEEIQKECQEKRKEKGYVDDKVIGAPCTEPAAKKQRKK